MGFFGPSKKEVWQQLADEIEANYINNGFLENDRVEAYIGNWIIVLDTYAVQTGKTYTTYTRIRAPFISYSDFYFKIYRTGLFNGIRKILGMEDIEIGHESFDEEFVIKSNSKDKVRVLFANENIRDLIQFQPKIHLEIRDDEGFFKGHFPKNADELYFEANDVIKDIDRLKGLFKLFELTLKELCNIGIAGSEYPEVRV